MDRDRITITRFESGVCLVDIVWAENHIVSFRCNFSDDEDVKRLIWGIARRLTEKQEA